MYVVTNRVISDGSSIEVFGDKPNPNGPNELRIVKVNKVAGKWKVSEIKDQLTAAHVKKLARDNDIKIDSSLTWFGSLEVAAEVFSQAKKEDKAVLFYVHGYNNDVGDILKTATALEEVYNVIVIPFTWPANGGGSLSGAASYLSDKADARASSGAFNRFVGKIQYYHEFLCEANLLSIREKVEIKYKDKANPEAAAALYTRLVNDECKIKINLLCHSMGNYLLKHSLMTSENASSDLVFDNMNLVAADTNNKNHADWLDKIDVRNRIHVVINEDDTALKASRVKPGREQRARLGHYLKSLNSENAVYIDVTESEGVGCEHSYFKGEPVDKNSDLKALFTDLFNGKSVEKKLTYFAADNYFKL